MSQQQPPTNRAAYLDHTQANPVTIRSAPFTPPSPDELTVHTRALAFNPVDSAIQSLGDSLFPLKYPCILGEDLAGTVHTVGSNLSHRFKPGDRVLAQASGVMAGNNAGAAFQDYVNVKGYMCARIPAALPFEDAAVLPLGLDMPAAGGQPARKGQAVLVWGAASSVGSCAVQLARRAGYTVVATASARNHGYAQDLGADAVLDYGSASVVDELVGALDATGERVLGAIDCIGHGTARKWIATARPYASIEGLDTRGVGHAFIEASAVQGPEIGDAIFEGFLEGALRDGTFRPRPEALVVGSGLESVQAALDRVGGGVSASKVVVSLA